MDRTVRGVRGRRIRTSRRSSGPPTPASLPEGWDRDLPTFGVADAQATRQASGKALNAIAARVPELIGGDADLSASTNTTIKDGGSFDAQSGAGRNIHFGVREHAMGAIANGIAYHRGLRPFVATFFCFSDYMRPSVRLAALNGLPVIFVWTHDSIGLGEDGPTHQPVEQLMSLRAMPNLAVVRPADANETAEAWRWALTHEGPVALVLSRQKLPVVDRARTGAAAGLARGAYVLADADGGSAGRHPHRHRVRGLPGRRRTRAARGDRRPRARRVDAVLGDVRGAGCRRTATRSSRRRSRRASRSRPA